MRGGSLAWILAILSLTVPVPAQSYPATPPQAAPPAARTAEPACPWLTAGSAAHVLGGPVRVAVNVAVNVAHPAPGECTFVSNTTPRQELKILVGSAGLPGCPAASASVSGIGTQASRCHLPHPPGASSGEPSLVLSGRVRTLHFAVALSPAETPVQASARREDALESIAEQVAGNLF